MVPSSTRALVSRSSLLFSQRTTFIHRAYKSEVQSEARKEEIITFLIRNRRRGVVPRETEDCSGQWTVVKIDARMLERDCVW